jgi:hypothetical protein
MSYTVGSLFALMGGAEGKSIRRIVRVVEDRGKTVLVRSDEELENEAAVEYDFDTLKPWEGEVKPSELKPIVEDR